jgi:hypothetical protein
MEYIHKSIARYSAMEKATTEEEFQRLFTEHDKLTDAQRLPRFARRTSADMKEPFHGDVPSTRGPKLPKDR